MLDEMPLAFTFASTAGATADDATRDGARAFNLPAGERRIAEAIRRFILLRYCTRDEEWSMVGGVFYVRVVVMVEAE